MVDTNTKRDLFITFPIIFIRLADGSWSSISIDYLCCFRPQFEKRFIHFNLPTVVWEGGLSPRHRTAFGELVVKLAQRTLTRKPLVTALGDCPSVVLRAGLNWRRCHHKLLSCIPISLLLPPPHTAGGNIWRSTRLPDGIDLVLTLVFTVDTPLTTVIFLHFREVFTWRIIGSSRVTRSEEW